MNCLVNNKLSLQEQWVKEEAKVHPAMCLLGHWRRNLLNRLKKLYNVIV